MEQVIFMVLVWFHMKKGKCAAVVGSHRARSLVLVLVLHLVWPWQSQSRWLHYTEIRQKMSFSGHSSESVKLSSGKTNSVPWAIRAATSYKSSLPLVWNCFLFYSLSFIMLISANPVSECELPSTPKLFQMCWLLMPCWRNKNWFLFKELLICCDWYI